MGVNPAYVFQQRQDPAGMLCIHRSEVCMCVCAMCSTAFHTIIRTTCWHNTRWVYHSPQYTPAPTMHQYFKAKHPRRLCSNSEVFPIRKWHASCWGTTPTMHWGGSHRDAHNVFACNGGCFCASVSLQLNVFYCCFTLLILSVLTPLFTSWTHSFRVRGLWSRAGSVNKNTSSGPV